MAEESVYIDLDEVQSSAKTILGLLKELEGPANQLEAAVKQVQASVYGVDLLGKSLQGSGSSVGGLGQHQEQVMAGIRVLMQNATAMGENLVAMAARHEANDQQHAAELTRIGATGTTPAAPVLAGLPTAGQVHLPTAAQVHLPTPGVLTPRHYEGTTLAPLGEPDRISAVPTVPGLRPDGFHSATPDLDPITRPAPIAPVSVPDAGVAYHGPDAPELHYNDNPNPLFEYYAAD
ncbi:hypothetical protein [Kitasatospora sp. NBC_00315]|uniref:hypothetical protein n=1 Tax=Kitasatospora sp. NBC_00315 TaxID=2975963 RepID=UPI00324DFFBC